MRVILYLFAFSTVMFFFLQWTNQNDLERTAYWSKRLSDCRSLGNGYDLVAGGECVQVNE